VTVGSEGVAPLDPDPGVLESGAEVPRRADLRRADLRRADLRRVVVLAAPALVVLAAEPLYVLVDTAVVGHLGGTSLGSLALGGSVMTFAAWVGGVLAYGTTGRAARRFGAGDRDGAIVEGVQASWIALVAGLGIVAAAQIFAGPVTRALAGSSGDLATGAQTWLRIASFGVPGLLLATAGNGWMRGVQDTRRPLYYVLGANVMSAVLCPLLVYPVGLGLTGSAVANVTAQTLVGTLFVRALLASKVSLRPRRELLAGQLSGNRDLLVRGAAFQVSFLSAAAVASRFGAPALGAHQIALQLWMFCSLTLDALAIAAQSLIGAALGASDVAGARALARRIAYMGLAGGTALAVLILAGWHAAPRWFSSDPRVYAQAAIAWPWFVAMQPLAGVVFALDGVLIGAGDLAFLRNLTVAAAVFGFLPLIWLSLAFGWGIGGIWAGLALLIVIRLAGTIMRTRSGRWAIAGAER
jgi:putative MATE family efflux protein